MPKPHALPVYPGAWPGTGFCDIAVTLAGCSTQAPVQSGRHSLYPRWRHGMTQLILEPTAVAQWQALVQEAQGACAKQLDETLESYLVFLLMRFTRQPHCTARIMAEDFLAAGALQGSERVDRLREVGDHCLLFSGLFPHLAERRLVRISYFVNIGRTSYRQLSDVLDHGWAHVYGNLSEAFTLLMDILHAMRGLGGTPLLTPLQALELWQDTGSHRSYRQVCGDGRVTPLHGSRNTH